MAVNFSIVLIAKNEAKTLPRLVKSLEQFQSRGGEIILVDTGSSDNTSQIAEKLGCKVTKVNKKFMIVVDDKTAHAINTKFVVGKEKPIVKVGDKIFDFASARNYAASLASNDMVSMPDCDEVFTNLDIDYIESRINSGIEQCEFNFVFAHDSFGKPIIKFIQCKMYNRVKMKWVGVVHEVLQGPANRELIPEDKLLIEHWQNQEQNRTGYLPGLALDCHLNPTNDRNSHYFGRELLWTGRPASATKEFLRHVAMNCWPTERAQSMIYIGDAAGQMNNPELQVQWYTKAYMLDSSRREALIKLASFYKHNNNYQATAAYANAALTIPWTGYYANDMSHYTNLPHELLYWSHGWMGQISEAQKHILKALEYQPYNPVYLRDTKYYFEFAAPENVEGWMRFPELTWLYEASKGMDTIAEVGSWKGRSTNALCSGAKLGNVTAIDHFMGSVGEDIQHREAKKDPDAVYKAFLENTKQFTNLTVHRSSSEDAAAALGSFDMIFIDAEHTYEGVKKDIALWKPKTKILLCGHDYSNGWPGVKQAVNEMLGEVGVCDSIWYKWLHEPKVSIVIPTLGRPEKLSKLLSSIRENADYTNYEVIVKPDNFPPNNVGVPNLVKEAVAESSGELIMYLGNDCVPQKGFLRHAVNDMIRHYPNYNGLIGLNDCYWNGEIATHWLAGKKLLDDLDGEFFNTAYKHYGCDNELTERCRKLGLYFWSCRSQVYHEHPINGYTADEVNNLAESHKQDDIITLEKRFKELGFNISKNLKRPLIPKRIFSIWLNEDDRIPEDIGRYIETHKLPGYEHHLITLKNCDTRSQYVKDAIAAKKWVKAADYLRIQYLYDFGGIYVDSDAEILKPFSDEMLTHEIFCGVENNKFVNTAIMGAAKNHPILLKHLKNIEANFKGDDDLTFESGVELWTKMIYPEAAFNPGIMIYPPEYFTPYDHQQNTINITENSYVYHHFAKTWIK